MDGLGELRKYGLVTSLELREDADISYPMIDRRADITYNDDGTIEEVVVRNADGDITLRHVHTYEDGNIVRSEQTSELIEADSMIVIYDYDC